MSLAVIIPNYNNEKFLTKCIDSVLAQTLLPDEIIIVDDVSTDNSRELINELAKKSNIIKPIFLSENGGVSHARNTGIKAAESEYITTLDADDFYYSETKLENEMALINSHSEDIVAYSKIVICNEDGELIRKLDYPDKEYAQGDILIPLLSGNVVRTLMRDFVFKKKYIIEAGLYNENMNLFEDYDVIIRLSKLLPFYCTFDYGTAYRQKGYGLSHRSEEELFNTKLAITDSYLSSLDEKTRKKIRTQRRLHNYYRIKNQIRYKLTK